MKYALLTFLATALLWSCQPKQSTAPVYEADVIIYGGTSAAVIAAVEVSQSGKSVLIVSPTPT